MLTTAFATNLHTIKTTTYPDNTTRIEAYYQDGTLSKVTGSAVHPVKYVYEAKCPPQGSVRVCAAPMPVTVLSHQKVLPKKIEAGSVPKQGAPNDRAKHG